MEVIQRVFRSELTVGRTALLLGISERQCYRIKRRASKHRSRRERRALRG
jgi:DNA-directed RNA polymerase specialized sigma subunit